MGAKKSGKSPNSISDILTKDLIIYFWAKLRGQKYAFVSNHIYTMFKDLENITYKQILLLGLLILIGLIVFAGGGMLLANLFWSSEDIIAAQSGIIDSPARISFMKYFHFMSMFGTFFFPAVALSLLAKSYNFSFLYINRGVDSKKVIMIFAMILILLPIINFLAIWNQGLHLPEFMSGLEQWMNDKEAQLTEITEKFMLTTSIGGLIINILIMAVLPALSEEFIFRGILMKWFNKSMGIHLSIVLSAIIFSAIHIQFLGFFPRFFLGIVLGYVFYWSGSLWASILLHFLNNAMIVTTYFLVARGIINVNPDTVGTIDNTAMLLLNILIFGALMYWFYRNRVKFRL